MVEPTPFPQKTTKHPDYWKVRAKSLVVENAGLRVQVEELQQVNARIHLRTALTAAGLIPDGNYILNDVDETITLAPPGTELPPV